MMPFASAKKPLTLFLVGDETLAEQSAPEDDNNGSYRSSCRKAR